MKRLLWWCICLWVVDSPLQVVSGQWSVVGITAFGDKVPSRALRNRQVQEIPPTGHRPPITDHLPCQDSSPTCLNALGDLAVQNSREMAVVKQAIALQKKTLWTSWLNADGLNPFAIGLRLARNIAGGGDRAAAKLELARLLARRAELATNVRQTVLQAVLEYERAQQQLRAAQTSRATHSLQLRFAEIRYRLGEGSTEAMLQLWQMESELHFTVEAAITMCNQRRLALEIFVQSSPTLRQ